MDERAATHRRLYYTITEVQLLLSLAAVLTANALALVGHVTSVLSSAPRLLHFGMSVLGLAGNQLRMVYAVIALTLRRSSQADAAYSNRTWRDYKNNRDFRRDFRFDRDHIPRLIAALQLPATIRSGGYCFTADDAISVLLFMLANDATLVKVNQKLGIKRAKASVIFRWTVHWLRDRWYKPLFVTDFHRWLPCFEEWARAVLHVQGGDDGMPYTGIIAFIDGTLIPTCRPAPWLQRAFYSGYKKQHGVHWQGCLAPMGLIISNSTIYATAAPLARRLSAFAASAVGLLFFVAISFVAAAASAVAVALDLDALALLFALHHAALAVRNEHQPLARVVQLLRQLRAFCVCGSSQHLRLQLRDGLLGKLRGGVGGLLLLLHLFCCYLALALAPEANHRPHPVLPRPVALHQLVCLRVVHTARALGAASGHLVQPAVRGFPRQRLGDEKADALIDCSPCSEHWGDLAALKQRSAQHFPHLPFARTLALCQLWVEVVLLEDVVFTRAEPAVELRGKSAARAQ